MLKSLTRTVAGSFFLSIILAAMMGLLVVTLRWSHQGRTELKSRLRKGKPEIIIFWHESSVSIVYWLIGLHLLGACYHWIKNDGVWESMVPILNRNRK